MASGPLTKPNNRVEIAGDYVATEADRIVAITDIAAPISVTLADPTVVGRTEGMLIKDESGLASNVNTITIAAPGGALIQGLASVVIDTAFGAARFYSTGEAWFFV